MHNFLQKSYLPSRTLLLKAFLFLFISVRGFDCAMTCNISSFAKTSAIMCLKWLQEMKFLDNNLYFILYSMMVIIEIIIRKLAILLISNKVFVLFEDFHYSTLDWYLIIDIILKLRKKYSKTISSKIFILLWNSRIQLSSPQIAFVGVMIMSAKGTHLSCLSLCAIFSSFNP